MDAEQARQTERMLRRLGIPGVVAPESPDNPAGPWRVYDGADPANRKDTTADALASLAAKFHELSPELPEVRQQGPTRGFVLPPETG